jgi:hypothetical protein
MFRALIEREYQKSYQQKNVWKQCLNRYVSLTPEIRRIADEGIQRFVNACKRSKISIDVAPIREIIEDALDNRQIWKESDRQFIERLSVEPRLDFNRKLNIKSSNLPNKVAYSKT